MQCLIQRYHFLFSAIGAAVACIGLALLVDGLSAPTVYSVGNPPSVDSVVIATASGGQSAAAIDLAEATSTNVYIRGTASDPDGCSQIDGVASPSVWAVSFYRTDVTGSHNCSANNANCYHDTEEASDLSGCIEGEDTDLSYEMDIPVQFYADATDTGSSPDRAATTWTAYVQVTDDDGNSANGSATVEMNTLKALSVTTTVAYGTLSLGGQSAEKTVTIRNTGNDNDLDPTIKDAAGWTCSSGSFGAGNVHWNTVGGQGYAAGTAVTGSNTDLNNLSIAKQTSETQSTKDIYLMLQIPATGVGGACSSTLTFTAT